MKTKQNQSRSQIVATIGPASESYEVFRSMVVHNMDVVRFNFSFGDLAMRARQFGMVRDIEKELGRKVSIMIDLPGPRIQKSAGHSYDKKAISSITEQDKKYIEFGIQNNVDYFAVSFVSSAKDINDCREIIQKNSGVQKIIAKIERKSALDNIDEIILAADALMIARGDLGNEVPIEQIPFIQNDLIKKCKLAGKPVITATQMLLSMVENESPTRAEVTDVSQAILEGSDAVMLSEETASGKYPVQAVAVMEKIVFEAEKHNTQNKYNLL